MVSGLITTPSIAAAACGDKGSFNETEQGCVLDLQQAHE